MISTLNTETKWPSRCTGCGKVLDSKRPLVRRALADMANLTVSVSTIRQLVGSPKEIDKRYITVRDGIGLMTSSGQFTEERARLMLTTELDGIPRQLLDDLLDPVAPLMLLELIVAINDGILTKEFAIRVLSRVFRKYQEENPTALPNFLSRYSSEVIEKWGLTGLDKQGNISLMVSDLVQGDLRVRRESESRLLASQSNGPDADSYDQVSVGDLRILVDEKRLEISEAITIMMNSDWDFSVDAMDPEYSLVYEWCRTANHDRRQMHMVSELLGVSYRMIPSSNGNQLCDEFITNRLKWMEVRRLLEGESLLGIEYSLLYERKVSIGHLRELVDRHILSFIAGSEVLSKSGMSREEVSRYLRGYPELPSEEKIQHNEAIPLSELRELIDARRLPRGAIESLDVGNLAIVEQEPNIAVKIDQYLKGEDEIQYTQVGQITHMGDLRVYVEVIPSHLENWGKYRFAPEDLQKEVLVTDPMVIERIILPLKMRRRREQELNISFNFLLKGSEVPNEIRERFEQFQLRVPNIIVVDQEHPLDSSEAELLQSQMYTKEDLEVRVPIPLARATEFAMSRAGIIQNCCTKSVINPAVEAPGSDFWKGDRIAIELPSTSPYYASLSELMRNPPKPPRKSITKHDFDAETFYDSASLIYRAI